RAVKLVATRLDLNVDDAARSASVLCIVRVGDDLELLNRVHGRDVGEVIAALDRIIGGAIKQELVVAILAAVDGPVGNRPVVEGALVNGRTVVSNSGRERREHKRITSVEGQLGDAPVFYHVAAIRFE